ncbi:MAG: hypothetical protein KJI69_04940 [Patescibacteria group bacterium]|nr:hypothetical protein [Patescibacteria group bacterium]
MIELQLTQRVKDVLEKVDAGENPNELSDGNDEVAQTINEISCSDGFEYGVWHGGYIKAEDFFVGETLEEAKKAIELLGEMKDLWEKISIEF